MADLELLSKGIVNAINMYSNAMAQRAEIENYYVTKRMNHEFGAIDEEMKYERERRKKKAELFDDPIKQIEVQQYIKENPDVEIDLSGTPMESWYNQFKNKRQMSSQSLESRFPRSPMALSQISSMRPEGGFMGQQPQDWQMAIKSKIDEKAQSGVPLSSQESALAESTSETDFKKKMEDGGWIKNPNWTPGSNKDRWVKKDIKTEFDMQERELKKQNAKNIIIESARDTISTIEKIEEQIEQFGFLGPLPSIPGTKRVEWEENIKKLLSTRVLDVMNAMKNASRTGATGFGQLSNKELAVLQNASTALKRKMSPQAAQEYLTKMKEVALKLLPAEESEEYYKRTYANKEIQSEQQSPVQKSEFSPLFEALGMSE